jgi:hypothetical protein
MYVAKYFEKPVRKDSADTADTTFDSLATTNHGESDQKSRMIRLSLLVTHTP